MIMRLKARNESRWTRLARREVKYYNKYTQVKEFRAYARHELNTLGLEALVTGYSLDELLSAKECKSLAMRKGYFYEHMFELGYYLDQFEEDDKNKYLKEYGLKWIK